MQKKNLEEPNTTSSVPTSTPSSESAQTTTVPAPEETITGNIQSPLPQEGGTSESVPFISGTSLGQPVTPTTRKVDQKIFNKVVRDHIFSSKFRGQQDMVDTFFKELKKRGYSDDQINQARIANDDLSDYMMVKIGPKPVAKPVEPPAEIDKEILKQVDPLANQWGILQPLADWSNEFAEKTVKNIEHGLETAKSGVEGVLNALGSQTGSVDEKGAEVVNKGLKTVSGGTEVAFNVIPVAVAFNAGADATKTLANKNLSKENAAVVEEVVDLPFMLGTKAATALGYTPEEESSGAYLLEILNFVAAGAALKTAGGIKDAAKERVLDIKSIDDLKSISEKAAKGELTPEQQAEFNKYADNLKSVTLDDIKTQAQQSTTREGQDIAAKIEETQQKVAQADESQSAIERARIDHISDMKAMEDPGSKEFYDKAMQALDNPAIVDRIRNSLDEAVKAGELSAEEAQVRIDHFEKIVGIDKMIPEKISDPSDRMEAAKLIEKKNDLKESVRGKDPILAADEIAKVNAKVEKIDEKLTQLKIQANEKAKEAKKAGEETDVLNQEPPASPPGETVPEGELSGEQRVHAVWKRVLSEMKDEDLRKGLEKEGITYLVKKDAITESSAREVLDAAVKSEKLLELEKSVLDDTSKMNSTTRGTLSAMIGEHYFELYEKELDPVKKEEYRDYFRGYTAKAAAMATEGGQVGNAIGKIIKKMYSKNPDTLVDMMEKHISEVNEGKIDTKTVSDMYKSIKDLLESPEGQKAITEEIAKKSERLFGKEMQKKISDFFDSAKIKKDGKLYSSVVPIPPDIVNAAIEVMKQAALLGAKGAAIIEEGIRYIKDRHKDPWDEESFKKYWEEKLVSAGIKFGKKRSVETSDQVSILNIIEKKAGRLKKENRDKFLKEIVEEVEKEGGLTETRFKNMYAEALGLPTMTPELIEKVRGYAKIINQGEASRKGYIKALDDIIDAQREGASAERLKELSAAKDDAFKKMAKEALDAKKANEELSILFKGNKKLSDTLISMMQLGALTPGSIIKNITAMPGELVFRGVSANIAGPLDWMISGLANVGLAPEKWKERTMNVNARTVGLIKSTPEATAKMLEGFIHGNLEQDFHNREIANKITPVRAARNIIEGKTKGDRSALAANIIEALPQGYLAAGFGRMLASPDAFFRHLGEGSKAYELGVMKGLKGAELEKFMMEPGEVEAKKIKQAGDEFTFQQENYLTAALSGARQGIDRLTKKRREEGRILLPAGVAGALKVLGKTQALYVKTPTNVLVRTVKMISPEVSLIEAATHLYTGNKEGFVNAIGDAATAYAIRYMAVSLIEAGLVTPPIDFKNDPDEASMESDPDIKHGGKINYSALQRMMTGGDWSEKPDDVWVDYSKWTGSFGIALGGYAQMLKDVPKEDIRKLTTVEYAYKALPTVFQQTMDLTFMSQTAALVDALRDPQQKAKKAVVGTVGLLATPFIPNTASTVVKASQDTRKEIRDESITQTIINDFKYKLLPNNDLPSKVTLFGDKVATAPKGTNPYMYYLFNVVKPEDPDENSFSYKLMDLYHDTKDKRVIPTAPSNEITIGKNKVPLDPHQVEKLQQFVGSERKMIAKQYMEAGSYATDSMEDRISQLQKIYNEGKKNGTEMLIKSDSHLLEIRNQGETRKQRKAREREEKVEEKRRKRESRRRRRD